MGFLRLIGSLPEVKLNSKGSISGIFKLRDENSGAKKDFQFLIEHFKEPYCKITLWIGNEIFIEQNMRNSSPLIGVKKVIFIIFALTLCQLLGYLIPTKPKMVLPSIGLKLSQEIQQFLSS